MNTEKKRRLKGSVLFTVVCVMSILIIFLMSTLVLAAAASNRAHRSYSTSQAEYTARAAIESFSQAMGRNAAIAQTVINMNESDIIEPSVVIDEAGMGNVGYYDDTNTWVDDKIRIEYVDDTYVFTDGKWEPQQVLKVSATGRVGKEEKTVTAYIRKKAPDEPDPLSIKGFQTLGGGGYTATEGYISGAISMGITDDESHWQEHFLGNQSELETEMCFVNGNLKVAGNDISLKAFQFEKDGSKKGTGVVVRGNMDVQNNFVINVDYPYAERDNASFPWQYIGLEQKNIPYMFVGGKMNITNGLTIKTSSNTVTTASNGSPFNLFSGTVDARSNSALNMASTDWYIMDRNASGAQPTSYIGSAAATKLSAWSTSIANNTATQFYSRGGNIYCNHNLELKKVETFGDVRVNGDLTIHSGVKIHGNLIVSGAIHYGGNLAGIVDGDIYNGTGAGPEELSGLKEGYYMMANTYHDSEDVKPGYVKVRNPEYGNVAVENKQYPNFMFENVQYANYVDGAQATGIEQGDNQLVEGCDFVVFNQFAWWPEAKFKDSNGNEYLGTDKITILTKDMTTVEAEVSSLSSYLVQNTEPGPYQWQSGLYYKDGQYMSFAPYSDYKTGDLVSNPISFYLILADGSYLSQPTGDITIYQADMNGNQSGIVTDSFSVIYKVDEYGNVKNETTDSPIIYYKADINGNITSEETNTASVIYKVDKDGNVKNETTTENYTYYKPDKDGNATDEETAERSFRYKADVSGIPTEELTDDEFSYYKLDGTPSSQSEAMASNFYTEWFEPQNVTSQKVYYYKKLDTDPDGDLPANHASASAEDAQWRIDHAATEVEAFAHGAIYPLHTFTDAYGDVYPQSMTKKAICGLKDDGTEGGDDRYKIVSTLSDIKKSIGCKSDNTFDGNTYYKEVPNVAIVGGKYQGFQDVDIDTSSGSKTIDINSNAYVHGTAGAGGRTVTININPNGGSIWVVLDNCEFGGAKDHKVIVSGNGTVNFLIKGRLYMNGKAGFFTKSVYDQLAGSRVIVREDDKVNINYYGADGSSLVMDNQNVMCGVAKCPYTTISVGSQGYQKTFTYVKASGESVNYDSVNWIGNALFKEMTSSANNFKLLYTGSTDDGGIEISNDLLKESWTVMYYDVA